MKLAIFGILITLTGGVLTAFGWAYQKKAYRIRLQMDSEMRKNGQEVSGTVWSMWLWWIGGIWVLASQPIYAVGIAMANQSTLGVVGPFSLIANMLLARLYLNEPIRKWEYIGIMLFIPGAILTLLYASMENRRYTRQEFNELFFSPASMTYLGVTLFIIVFGIIISEIILSIHPTSHENWANPESESNNEIDISNATNVKEDKVISSESDDDEDLKQNYSDKSLSAPLPTTQSFASAYFMKMLSQIFANRRWRLFPLLLLTFSSCFLSSLSVCFSRSLSGMAIAKTETSKFGGMMPKVLLVMIVCNSLYSYFLLSKCLKHFNTVYVVPLLKAYDLLHNLLSGGILLQEFGEYSDKEFTIFMFGIWVCIISICMLLLGNEKNEQLKVEAGQIQDQDQLKV